MSQSTRYKVLFVCIGNSCRSPMAEAIANAKHSDVIEASSAGIATAAIVQPETYDCLAERKIPLAPDMRPTPLQKSDWRSMDIIVNMSGAGILPLIPGFEGGNLIWQVVDPMGRPGDVYRAARDLIEQHVDRLATTLREHRKSKAST